MLLLGLTRFRSDGVYMGEGAWGGGWGSWAVSVTDFIDLTTYIANAVDFGVAFVDDGARSWFSEDGGRVRGGRG